LLPVGFLPPKKKENKLEKGNKIMENPFLSIEYRLFNIKQLNDAEIIFLSFILSHQKQNKDFFYTTEQLVLQFNGRYTAKYIEKILKKLSDINLIQRITSKEYYAENNKWGNRRIIKVNLDIMEKLIHNSNIPLIEINEEIDLSLKGENWNIGKKAEEWGLI
jgi:hypothetical protein